MTGTDNTDKHELRIDDLRVSVAGRVVLDGVSLTVASGEVHAVMGPNGSGKSTLAHVLMGKPGYEVVSGSATFDGHDLLALPVWRRARLGLFLAPQNPIEVPGVTLAEVMHAALAERGTTRSSSEPEQSTPDVGGDDTGGDDTGGDDTGADQISKVGLDKRMLERAVNVDWSGGERKRSETLQLSVLRPSIAVLDELDSGIDIDGLRQVANRVVEAVAEWDLGVLAITHYRRLLNVLRPQFVHVLVRGQIVARGGPELAEELDRTGYGTWDKGQGDLVAAPINS